jgi:hypothetical protein
MDNKKIEDEINSLDRQIELMRDELNTLREINKSVGDLKEYQNQEKNEKIKRLEVEITRMGGKKEEMEFLLNKHVRYES